LDPGQAEVGLVGPDRSKHLMVVKTILPYF